MRPKPLHLLEHREYPVLYVDDEPDNLRIFELTFRKEFEILTATSAQEGLELLNRHPVAVCLSDHRMPEITGTEFLRRVKELDPKTIRILVTAYGDAKILGDAINDGNIYRYVPKPWEPDDMRLTLRRAIEVYALERERTALIDELTTLNTLSRRLHAEIDLDRLLETLLSAMCDELGFDGGAALFLDDTRQRLEWVAIRPDDEVAARLRDVQISKENAAAFMESVLKCETQSLRIESSADLERPIRDWIAEVSADEILAVPLAGKHGVVGLLSVDNRRGGRPFGIDDQTLLDGLAMQAVIAIENARLIEEMRRSRAQVLRADRLGQLGTLAAGLAHEINNPLVCLNTFLTLAPQKRQEGDSDFWTDYHALACSELERIRGLVATMSKLGRGGAQSQVERQRFDLGELARQVGALIERELSSAGVTLVLDIAEGLPGIVAVRDHIHQMVLNLALNAVHASNRGGRVTLRVGHETGRDGSILRLCVSDTGEGIAEENLERIFDPFFTTKDPDKGTGLGLMISHQIVTDHDGSIEVESRPGQGATFTVRLPSEPGQSLRPAD